MKIFLKKIIKKCLLLLNIDVVSVVEKKVISNSRVSTLAKIYPPYSLIESSVSDYSYLAKNSSVHKASIGKFCSIGPNFMCGWGVHPTNGISTSPMFYSTRKQNGMTLSLYDKIEEVKAIDIGNDVFIGMNVTILDGVKIGDGAIIGAGAVVVNDIPPYAIAVGVPARVTKYRFSQPIIDKLLKVRWWDWEFDRIAEVEKKFFNVDAFVEDCE